MPLISAGYAGLLGLMMLALSVPIGMRRLKDKLPIGDGGQRDLSLMIRVQANFAEYVPLTLLLILLAELAGSAHWLVHGLGAALVLARLAHALGLRTGTIPNPLRGVGITLNWLVLLVAALLDLGAAAGWVPR